MARGPEPRPRHLDRAGPVAAAAQARRVRDRRVLPAEGADGARAAAERPRRLAVVRCLGRGPGARPGDAVAYRRGKAALRDRLPRSPLGPGATVRRHAGSLEARHLDARHSRARRTCEPLAYMDEVFGFVPPTAMPPGEEADPDDPQAGTRVRRRHGCSRPRTRSISTTRRCRMRARGSSAGCRPSATRHACSRAFARQRAEPTSKRSTSRSAASRSGSSCSSAPRARRRRSLPLAGRCRICVGH